MSCKLASVDGLDKLNLLYYLLVVNITTATQTMLTYDAHMLTYSYSHHMPMLICSHAHIHAHIRKVYM